MGRDRRQGRTESRRCTGPGCPPGCCPPATPSRRDFLLSVAAAGAGLAVTPIAGPFGPGDIADFPVPADKRLSPEWMRSLRARGEPHVWTKARNELRFIGMPVGGIGCGQLYLGGDGRLWHWDVLNAPQADAFRASSGPHYAKPAEPRSPFAQGFALRVAGIDRAVTLDAEGFADVRFRGEYPIGRVAYRDPTLPVEVDLDAFSPFIPLDVDASSLPCTFLRYRIRNTSDRAVDVTIGGWLENAALLASAVPGGAERRVRALRAPSLCGIHCDALPVAGAGRPDMVVADFESGKYDGWTATGTAFGAAPRALKDIAGYQGNLRGQGAYAVNTHETRNGEDVAAADRHVGTLTSAPFRIDRAYLGFRIGGGNHPGQTCVNLLVDGAPVRTATGRDDNAMRRERFDLREGAGRMAQIEIVDGWTGAWGNVGADAFILTDSPVAEPIETAPDFGSLALGIVDDDAAVALADLGAGAPAERVFAAAPGADEARRPVEDLLVAGVRAARRLEPGGETTVTFVIAWHFPRTSWDPLPLPNADSLRREYARRFADAAAVAAHAASNAEALVGGTELWTATWYDSTLPHWFLDRTMANTSTLATATCYRLVRADDPASERFYGWEGTYCCAGTCQHVWQYAQAVARLFPALERNVRETVDFGLAWHESGAIDYRAEAHQIVAHDGFAGTILRAWREHQMSPDARYLTAIWPRVRRSLEFFLAEDKDRDGLLEGAQYNTLDATWYGPMAWISSLYLAALRAGEAMALEMGDVPFAATLAERAERGSREIVAQLFNGDWFVHRADPEHPEANTTNDGCHIDQVFGQSFAMQLGLPRVVPEKECVAALRSLYRYSFAPDIGPYRAALDAKLPGGRWYAMPGEGGLLMCTWPPHRTVKDTDAAVALARGKGREAWAAGYFVECMSGFEHQVASHMIAEGLVDEGLAIERMIHDRYDASKRNPYNEVECSDHYARAMASYGAFVAISGFTVNGPKGEIGFAPRLTPEAFRAAFVAATGWGTFAQSIDGASLEATLAVRHGSLAARAISLEIPDALRGSPALRVAASVDGDPVPATVTHDGSRAVVRGALDLGEGTVLRLTLSA